MKFRVTMKAPDALIDAIEEAINETDIDGLTEEELEDIKQDRGDKVMKLCHKWLK